MGILSGALLLAATLALAPALASPAPSPSPAGAPAPAASAAPATPAPAGVVPSEVSVELAGLVSSDFAGAQITAAIARAAQLAPGASVSFGGVTLPPRLSPGIEVEALARVHLSGNGAGAGVDGTTAVHLRVESLAQLDPSFLLYSDDPEKIPANANGLLFRDTLAADEPSRVYAYHVGLGPDTRLYLALRSIGADARVQILGYAAGPAATYGFVGHVATLRYLLERSTQESTIVSVASGVPYLMLLAGRPMNPNELVAAIFDLRVLAGGPLDLAVVAASGDADPATLLDGPALAGDSHGRSGRFSLTSIAPIVLGYTAGAAEAAPIAVGGEPRPNLVPGGRALLGDYGVLRDMSLLLANPTNDAQAVYLYETPNGGSATATLWFTGDPQPTEMPCVHDAGARYLVRQFTLAPGQSEATDATFMTDGASSYPILFGLTATPPSPPPGYYSPDACNVHLPPSPSPESSPSALPAPSSSALPAPSSSALPAPSSSPLPGVSPSP
jgi:hypothetical protein